MSVAASCDALYFPDVPKDNIITLKYNDEGNPLQPNTLVLFKVKTSAPGLFHVLPRYGALLVADPSGSSPDGFKGGSVAFALRENYASGGGRGDADEDDPSVSPTRATSAGDGNSPGGQPRFQERFAIEYVVLHNESLAYQQVAHCVAEPARLTEAAKSVWTLTTAGAIPKAHIGTRSTINLRAYLRNVVLNASDPSPLGDEKGKVVVPANATLVDPCMQERLGSTARSPASTASAGRRSLGGSTGRNTKGVADELRALRDEVQQRRDSVQPGGVLSPNTSKPASNMGSNRGSLSSLPASKATAAGGDVGDVAQIMSLTLHGSRVKSGKKGIKLYLVVAMMFIVYVFALWMRRGGVAVPKADGNSQAVVGQSGSAKRSPTVKKGPLGLPSNNNTVAMGSATW